MPRKNKRLRRLALWALIAALVLYHFPLHNMLDIFGMEDYYTPKETMMLVTRGPVWELFTARGVMEQAEEAFSDRSSESWQAALERYGILGRYSTTRRGAAYETHSLRLLSTHFFGESGYLWVSYSQETHDGDGRLTSGRWGCCSLWELEKNVEGKWEVVGIREHP